MNRPGRMNDNAHMESFFHSMKGEELYGKKFETEQQLRGVLTSYIRFYNDRRLHSSLQYLPRRLTSADRKDESVSTKPEQDPTLRQGAAQCRWKSCTVRPLAATCRSPLR